MHVRCRSLGEQYIRLTGDVLLAAGQIAYLGPFTAAYRSDVLRDWVRACQAKAIPCGDRFRLSAVLGDPVKVRLGLVSNVFFHFSSHFTHLKGHRAAAIASS